MTLTNGMELPLGLLIPDVASMLGLKLHARRARDEDRDAWDLWTCMELVAAAGELSEFWSPDFDDIRDQLGQEFGDDGPSMQVVTADVNIPEVQRRRTRIRGLVRAIAGRRARGALPSLGRFVPCAHYIDIDIVSEWMSVAPFGTSASGTG